MKRLAAVLLAILAGTALAAEGDFAGSGAPGGEVRLGLPFPEIRTLNALRAWDPATREALRPTFGTLTRAEKDSPDGKLAPGLAVSWESDAAGAVWTFRMRPGAKWSDGRPVTARDAALTIRAVVDPANAVPLAPGLGRGEAGARAEAVGEGVLRITLSRPDPGLPWILSEVPLIPAHKLGEAAARGALATAWGVETRDPGAEVVSCGPYAVKEYRPKERLVLEANPHYWRRDAQGQSLPYLKTVTWILAADEGDLERRWSKGEMDAVEGVDAERWGAFAAQAGGGGQVLRLPGMAGDFLLFCDGAGADPSGRPRVPAERAAWLANPAFRKGLALAIDRKALASAAPESAAVPGAALPGSVGEAEFAEDREEASRLLGAAGFSRKGTAWTDAQGKKAALSLLAGASAVHKALSAELARQWRAFGVEVAVEQVPDAVLWWRASQTRDFEVALVGAAWEPGNVAARFAPWWRALVPEAARAEGDAAVRKALVEAALFVPLTRRAGFAAAREKLQNVRPGLGRNPLTWNLEELFRPAR